MNAVTKMRPPNAVDMTDAMERFGIKAIRWEPNPDGHAPFYTVTLRGGGYEGTGPSVGAAYDCALRWNGRAA